MWSMQMSLKTGGGARSATGASLFDSAGLDRAAPRRAGRKRPAAALSRSAMSPEKKKTVRVGRVQTVGRWACNFDDAGRRGG